MPGMSEPQKKPGTAFWASVVTASTVSALGIYVLVYALMVAPMQMFKSDPSGVNKWVPAGYSEPAYREDSNAAATERLTAIFSPVHEIDRHIRPSVWGRRH
jgi:hypothetical protein